MTEQDWAERERDLAHEAEHEEAVAMADLPALREEPDNYDPDGWRADLLAAKWGEKSHTIWVDPNGAVYRGPYGAWREMKRRQRKDRP